MSTALAKMLGDSMRRAIAARGFDPRHPEVHRRLTVRLQPPIRISDHEAANRIRREVEEEQERRRLMQRDSLDLAALFAGIDDEPVD